MWFEFYIKIRRGEYGSLGGMSTQQGQFHGRFTANAVEQDTIYTLNQ